jgi:membrane associated rhomboid family serine protease
MLALFSLGMVVENYLGRNKYILLLISSLFFGSITSFLFNPINAVAVGSSGMIFGLFGSLLILGKQMGANLKESAGLLAINLAIPFLIPGIDWKAHLGGLIGGALTTLAFRPKRQPWE